MKKEAVHFSSNLANVMTVMKFSCSVILLALTLACVVGSREFTLLGKTHRCGNIFTIDRAPDNVPKGYVEFYDKSPRHCNYRWNVFKYENRKKIIMRVSLPNSEDRFRISARPGMHTFFVELGSASRAVTVKVIEGKITPVAVKIMFCDRSYELGKTTISFRMVVDIGKPMPFYKGKVEKNKSTDNVEYYPLF